MGLIAQYQQGAFTAPINGTTADASVVLSNDNSVRTKHNSHDADTTIHVQNGLHASRPAAGTAQRMWVSTDTGVFYVDSGVSWASLAYFSTAGGTLSGNLAVTGTLSATGNFAINTDKFTVEASTGNVLSAGEIYSTTDIIAANRLIAGSAHVIGWTTTALMKSPSDGVITLYNNALTGFTRLQFGGTTSSFPAIRRTTTALNIRLADDSGDAGLTAGTTTLGGTSVTGTLAVTNDVAVNTNKFTITASTGATVAASTITGSRIIGGFDVASTVAKGLFSDGTIPSGNGADITTLFGLVSSYTTSAGSGTTIGSEHIVRQAGATSGSVFALRGYAYTGASATTTTALIGTMGVVEAAASDTVTTGVAGSFTGFAAAGATFTNFYGVQISPPAGSGSTTTLVGLKVTNMGTGASIYAINTGTGLVQFGDETIHSASTTSRASLNIPHGSAPTSPVNGDMWTTTSGLFIRINGSTVGPLT